MGAYNTPPELFAQLKAMADRIGALEAQVTAGQAAWLGLAYTANYSDFAGGYGGGAYRRDLTGRVFLRGLSKKNAAMVAADVIATLPAGFTPAVIETFTVVSGPVDQFGRIDILTNGQIVFRAGTANAAPYLSFGAISFSTT